MVVRNFKPADRCGSDNFGFLVPPKRNQKAKRPLVDRRILEPEDTDLPPAINPAEVPFVPTFVPVASASTSSNGFVDEGNKCSVDPGGAAVLDPAADSLSAVQQGCAAVVAGTLSVPRWPVRTAVPRRRFATVGGGVGGDGVGDGVGGNASGNLVGAAVTPSWARRKPLGAPAARGLGVDGQTVDQWDSEPGARFERICIGFNELGPKQSADEVSTEFDFDGEEPEEAYSDGEESSEVVRGFRQVDAGYGLPASSCDSEDLGLREHAEKVSEEAVNAAVVERIEAVADTVRADTTASAVPSAATVSASSSSPSTLAMSEVSSLQERVTHVLLVVHGIGATKEVLGKNVRDMKMSLAEMQKYWFWHTEINTHVEIIDWKTTVCASQHAIFERIKPVEASTTRMSINYTLSDVIYYKTARYRSRIHEVVAQKMNDCMRMLRADPSGRFEGARVSIVGHSLGSVIAYDVITGFDGSEADSAAAVRRLEFEVDNFFLWGSPLAAFASIDDEGLGKSEMFKLPQGVSCYNIFHPQDPVAFRLEPLVHVKEEIPPPEVVSYWANNGIRPSKQWVRNYEYAKGLAHQQWVAFKSRLFEAVGTSSQADLQRIQWDIYLQREEHGGDEAEAWPRIDFVLQEHAVEAYVESYGLLQSHFSYWTSRDVALLMLKKLLRLDAAEMNLEEHEQQVEAAKVAEAAAAAVAAAEAAAAAKETASAKEASDAAEAETSTVVISGPVDGQEIVAAGPEACPSLVRQWAESLTCVNRDRGEGFLEEEMF
eukprot:TRINITY_DN75067_c0_g1_i1.p1 TRINITY_DN75067_c0_g1~~TRINITY_DN75067_c0_g1_i1.p1  ORF type:complete len:771 (+),score=175.22 TRINITY_DN75067_c0_g1_i1:123-2435(+)